MSSAPKSAQNFVRFRFGEFIENYFSADTRQKRSPYCLMGKAFNDVAAKKEKAKKRDSDNTSMAMLFERMIH